MLNKKEHALFCILKPILLPTTVAVVLQIMGSLSAWIAYTALVKAANLLLEGNAAIAVYKTLGWFLIGLGLQSGLGAFALVITHFTDANLQRRLRYALIDKLGKLPLFGFNVQAPGKTRQIIQNDVDALHQLVAHTLVEGVAFICTPLVGLLFCFSLDWQLGVAACIPLLIYFMLFNLLSRTNMHDIMSRIALCLADISAAIVDYFRGVAVLKVFGQGAQGYTRFSEASRTFHDNFITYVRPAMRVQAIAAVVLTPPIVAFIIGTWGSFGVYHGGMGAVDVMVASIVAMLLPASIMTIVLSNQVRSAAVVAAQRIIDVLDAQELPNTGSPVALENGTISFEKVNFDYDGQPILHNINLTLPAGSFTALVGPSGAGKSTLAQLILRYQDVSSGRILLDGHDIRDLPLSQLYRNVAVLEQTPSLPALTLAENIALGMGNVSLARIRAAARQALIDERIMALPKGYDAIPGVDVRLSGGEAQRVAIARLILMQRPIVIMDEATSAIDPDAEAEIRQAIANLIAGRTTLAIAHRLASIDAADQIIVVDRGYIVEKGNHSSLVNSNGLYAWLWKQQNSPITV